MNTKKGVMSRILSVGLAGLITVSTLVSSVGGIVVSASTDNNNLGYQVNTDNTLWLTEIYPNDVNRNSVYGTTSDLMEFVEITNTGNQDINFNQGYGLYYQVPSSSGNSYDVNQLSVTDVSGSVNVTIKAGETVVIWSQRTDITGGPTEAQFRKEMNVSDNVQILRCSGQNGFADDNRGFAIKKTDGTIVSQFQYKTGVDTADGLAVELAIPDFGNQMKTYKQLKPSSAGIAYYGQLNGRTKVSIPTKAPDGLYITEIRPNDSNRDAQFGSGSNDIMECLELTNSTDADINLNDEYALYYVVSQGNKKLLTISSIDRSTNKCVIPAHSSAVIWSDRQDYLKQGVDYTVWPTEQQFRTAYNLSDTTPVFVMTNQNGLSNTQRGFELRKVNSDKSQTVLSSYFWDGVNDVEDNKSVDLAVNPQGPEMLISTACAATNLGTVKISQISYAADDGSKPSLALLNDTTTYNQGDFIRIPYSYSGTETMPVTSMELYYKTPDMQSFACYTTTNFAIYNKYYAFIPSDIILNANYVDYYVKAWNNYHYTQSEVRRLTNNKLNNATGLSVRINDAAATDNRETSDTIYVSAKNYEDAAAPITATLDGKSLNFATNLEDAFYTLNYSGIDSYFKNALTCGDKVIKLMAQCSEIPSDSSMAIPVNGSYFTYNADGSASIELALRTGTYGSTWESNTAANNDDFTISKIGLSLPDGTSLTPSSFVNENGTALDYSQTTKIGDLAGCNLVAKAVFTIPAGQATAKGINIDTKTLIDGMHTLTVISGTKTKTITLNVKNSQITKPVAEKPDYNMGLSVEDTADSVNATVTGVNAGDQVILNEAKAQDAIKVYEGSGDTTYGAAEESGDKVTTSIHGEFPYQIYEVSTNGSLDESMRFDVAASDDYNRDIQLYALNTTNDQWEILDTDTSNGKIAAVFSLKDRIKDGKVKILVQARGTETTPVIAQDNIKSSQTSTDWDGTTVPSSYDFSFAWISDTQYYSEQYLSNFTAMTDWIVNNKSKLGIDYVIHTGDIADEFNEEYEFSNASNELKKFENAGIPYGVLAGNHDVAHGNERHTNYWKYFGADRYINNSYYGGTYDNNLGHYDLVTVDGQELLMLYMSWDIYADQIAWMNSVLDKYPDRKAIICIHGGIDSKATQSYFSDELLNQVAKTHSNVFAILNGHYHGSSMNFVGFDDNGDGVNDRTVYQVCTDYQSAPQGGEGYVKMLYFDLTNNKIYMNSYSPVLNDTNFFDTSKRSSYKAGDIASDIDIMELDAGLKTTTAKTLTVTSTKATLLTNQALGIANAGSSAKINFEKQDEVNPIIYAVEKNSSTGKVVAYSELSTYTHKVITNSGNFVAINSGSRANGAVNTGDHIKTSMLYILGILLIGSAALYTGLAFYKKRHM